jgi:chemotaxis protein methyltransferase CheR
MDSGAGPADLAPALRAWVETHFGLHFAPSQHDAFRARLERFCRDVGLTHGALHRSLLAGDRALVLRLAEAMSTNYTGFFREPEAFAFLGDVILPALPPGEAVRVWSAASSSGEEACSLATVLCERLGEDAHQRAQVLGTDLSDRQVRLAEEGVYAAPRLEALSPERRARFEPLGLGQWRAGASLRRLCTFRRLNLTQTPWPFAQRFHVIFLRNVLYYFAPQVRRAVIEACYDAAEPGGWLVTSFTEPMLDLETRWRQLRPAVFRKPVR